MRLELSQIRLPETGISKVFEPADLPGEGEEYRVKTPVALRLTIHQDHDRYRLVGTVKTQLDNLFMKLDCRRETELVRVLLSVPRLFDQQG